MDHPRSRGEYLSGLVQGGAETGSSPLSRGIRRMAPFILRVLGSSPLSRGILGPDGIPYAIGRIIPALAGNTTSLATVFVHDGDHPRSRGEYC